MTRATSSERRVLIVQRRMAHYRVAFFDELKRRLGSRGITLSVAYGSGTAAEMAKRDAGILDWGERLATRYFLRDKICWQPFAQQLSGCDMVIVTHENQLICNLYSQYVRTDIKVGLWGHGANLQGVPSSLRERYKRQIGRQADWWFGYTTLSLPLIEKTGFPADRITILNNSVDMAAVLRDIDAVSHEELADERLRLGLEGDSVGVFVGSLYREKRIEFMLQCAQDIKARVPGFEFIVVGDGPQRAIVESFCANYKWVKFAGPLRGVGKAKVLRLANVILNPGALGLGILDSFAFRLPLVTTDSRFHGPEISYLKSGYNGLITADARDEFVSGVVRILSDGEMRRSLQRGCAASAAEYSLERMAENFSKGVLACLDRPPHRGAI